MSRYVRWTPISRLFATHVPTHVAAWLFDQGSLTRRLIEHCHGRFSVRLLNHVHARPSLDETRRLGLNASSYALIREVHLLCDEQTLVFARSVIPHSTMRGRNRRLAHLGDKPLGAYLFAQRNLHRSEMEVAALLPGMELFQHARQGLPNVPDTVGRSDEVAVWGRRSVFRVHGRPLLVAECFLPELFGGQDQTGGISI